MASDTSKSSDNKRSRPLPNSDSESRKTEQSSDSSVSENDSESGKILDTYPSQKASVVKDLKSQNIPDKNNKSISSEDEDGDQCVEQKISTPKKGFRKRLDKTFESSLSSRMEYLSRPKKDYLDNLVDTRLDGSLPEDAYPSWHMFPLPTKILFDQCPIAVTRRNLSISLFLPPPGEDFDLEDENNLVLPSTSYENLHDPNLKDHVRSKNVYNRLKECNYITESERVTCTLEDINRYRRYQRRILAAEARHKLRDEDESFRKERAKGMEEKIKRDIEKYQQRRTQGELRRWIKNAVASIMDSSMEKQRIQDMKVLNSKIQRRRTQRDRVEDSAERYQNIYAGHIEKKYADAEKRRRDAHLKYAKKDLDRVEKLCNRQEEEGIQRKAKLEEFWMRKSEWQKVWIEEGEGLERLRQKEKKENIDILKRTGRLPTVFTKKRDKDGKKGKGEKLSDGNNQTDDFYDTAREFSNTTSDSGEDELSFKTADEYESHSFELNTKDLHDKSAEESPIEASEAEIKAEINKTGHNSENDSKLPPGASKSKSSKK